MAGTVTYLTLTNLVLRELNEVELTSSTFSASRGVQTAVKGFVNKSVNDLYNAEVEWPWLFVKTSQDTYSGQQEYTFPASFRKADFDTFRLKPKQRITNTEFTSSIDDWVTVSGTPSHVSVGNGRMRLNLAEVTQSISVIKNRTHKLAIRIVDSSASGNSLSIKIGTSIGGTEILSDTIAVSETGNGTIYTKDFVPSSSAIYIGLENSSSNDLDIDFVRLSENELPISLKYASYDDFIKNRYDIDEVIDDSQYDKPLYVYRTQDNLKFGLTPIPDSDSYTIEYEYFKTHTELSAYDDVLDLPDRYSDTIVNRAKYYLYKLRNDVPMANIANAEYERGVERIRIEMLNKPDYMRDTRVNLNPNTATVGI